MTKKIKALALSRVQNYWYRQGFIKYFFVIFLLGFSYRIVTINQLDANGISVQEKGSIQASKEFEKKARRGDILDRNGDVLASNLILKKVNLDPTLVQPYFIPALAKALNMPESKLNHKIKEKLSRKAGRKNLIIKENLRLTDPVLTNIDQLNKTQLEFCKAKSNRKKTNFANKIWKKIQASIGLNINTTNKDHEIEDIKKPYALAKGDIECDKGYEKKKEKIEGMALQEDTRRYYPKSASMSPLIGRINRDKIGVSGIEGEFENILAGQHGSSQLSFSQNLKTSYFNPAVTNKLKHGQNIELTIDANIQFHAYTAIKKSVDYHDANSGSAIILTPNGEILAMANYPADNPNDKTIYNAQGSRNRALQDKIDPGSTMKPFTMMLALDKNEITATEDELIDVTKRIGHIKPDGKYQQMTIKKILLKSHNLGTVNVSERLSKEDMYNTWNKLGFGQPLGLIPSIENIGSLRHFSSWALSDKRSLSYGYGPMEANLAQLARAYLVFANDGAIPSLKLIKDVNIDENMTSIFSKDSIHKIANILDSVASNDGSGYRAEIKGYDIAGKTGTAEKIINGKYNKKGINRTFFTGFTPVNNPKYIMAVMLDHPKKCYSYEHPSKRKKCGGANSAAMTFKDAMENILTSDQSIKLLAKN